MPAFVEHSFQRGFLLDEEKLRKLRELIETRLSKNPTSPNLIYKVYRGDSYSYTTPSVDDVAKEDNEDWRRITRLELLVNDKDELNFLLSFSGKGCDLRITGADRDNVFLLFSDLRDYVQNEVAVVRGLQKQSARIVGLALMMLFMAAFFFSTFYKIGSSHLSEPKVKEILTNPDTTAKLNFLIIDKMQGDPLGRKQIWWMLGLFLLFPITSSGVLEAFGRYAFPGNEFLFGKRRDNFTKRQRLMSNLIWVVLVGLVVAVGGGFIVWWLTVPH